jgi:lipid A 3-O-deacylase
MSDVLGETNMNFNNRAKPGLALASALLSALCLTGPARAQQSDQPRSSAETGTLSLLFENDIFYNTDRDYTNGVAIAWTTAPADTPEFAIDLARSVPFFGQTGEVRTTYSIGQNIYTPSNLKLTDPDPTDRPYAGFLYLSMGVAR